MGINQRHSVANCFNKIEICFFSSNKSKNPKNIPKICLRRALIYDNFLYKLKVLYYTNGITVSLRQTH